MIGPTIQSKFSEANFEAITMLLLAMLQTTLIGTLLLVLVKELPQAWYLTMYYFIIHFICMVILLLIFVQKVL